MTNFYFIRRLSILRRAKKVVFMRTTKSILLT